MPTPPKHFEDLLKEAITYLAMRPLEASRRAMAAAWIADLTEFQEAVSDCLGQAQCTECDDPAIDGRRYCEPCGEQVAYEVAVDNEIDHRRDDAAGGQ